MMTETPVGSIALDGDCDGVLSGDDCDDLDDTDAEFRALVIKMASNSLDCDDADGSLGVVSLDADCDGVLTEDDCNDNDTWQVKVQGRLGSAASLAWRFNNEPRRAGGYLRAEDGSSINPSVK